MSFQRKNGCLNNENTGMATMESSLLDPRSSNCDNEFHCEFKNFPVTFVNALRRILLSEIPTVVVRDVEIVENTTQMPHEMLKHRVEMMPVKVLPSDSAAIRDTKIELHALPHTEARTLYNTDFSGGVLMNDRDLDTPLLFLKMRAGETVHIRGRLVRETKTASQVCTATTKWHIDPKRADVDRKAWVEKGEAAQVFDNFYIQKSYSRDEKGRPDWIDLDVESVGVVTSKELVKMSVKLLREMVDTYMKDASANIERYKDDEYHIKIAHGGHTVCALLQEVIYYFSPNINFVSYDIPHPLRPETVLRFQSKNPPETVLDTAHKVIQEYCSVVEKGLA